MSVKRTPRQRFVASVLAHDMVCEVSDLLAPEGIGIMPLKGVLLQRTLYADPVERAICDVDILVPDERYEEARKLLERAQFRPRYEAHSLMESCFFSPNGLVLDLHRQLFTMGRYRVSNAELFRRARLDNELFGSPVYIQDRYDTYAHLIGSFASDHAGAEARYRLQELPLAARHFELDVQATAHHLESCGLQRAALYTLSLVVELTDDSFARAVLEHLARDRAGVIIARTARFIIERSSPNSAVGAVPAHFLNYSLPAAASSLSIALVNRMRHRYRRLQEDGGEFGTLHVWNRHRQGSSDSTPPSA